MLMIEKRSGKEAEFDRKKLQKSIRSAGCNGNVAKTIADAAKHFEGMATLDLRKQVVAKLRRYDKDVGNRYEAYEKPAFRTR